MSIRLVGFRCTAGGANPEYSTAVTISLKCGGQHLAFAGPQRPKQTLLLCCRGSEVLKWPASDPRIAQRPGTAAGLIPEILGGKVGRRDWGDSGSWHQWPK